jgi:hypothetical protein
MSWIEFWSTLSKIESEEDKIKQKLDHQDGNQVLATILIVVIPS